ncbi:MAG: tyrosine-type recombinase/integrase [Acidimicrobiales bacterium]
MTALGDAATEYLGLRRALGFRLDSPGRRLAEFVAFADTAGAERVTVTMAMDWAGQASTPASVARRLEALRGFARWFQCLDPTSETVPAGVTARRRHRQVPYLFTAGDVTALMGAAHALRPVERGATIETVIGLLAATGMRVGEALRLNVADVDLEAGRLTIWHTKFNKDRRLPLSASTIDALADYHRLRAQLTRPGDTTSFFVAAGGGRLTYGQLRPVFVRLLEAAGVPSTPWPRRPHIHHLRHSFAVATVVDWYRAGLDTTALLPRLSTYLGHIDPTTTYWYLTATPELLGFAADRLDSARLRAIAGRS